jgi:hypothetical protein
MEKWDDCCLPFKKKKNNLLFLIQPNSTVRHQRQRIGTLFTANGTSERSTIDHQVFQQRITPLYILERRIVNDRHVYMGAVMQNCEAYKTHDCGLYYFLVF